MGAGAGTSESSHYLFSLSWTKANNNNNKKFQVCERKEHQTLWVELGEHSMRLKQPIQKISLGHMGW